MWNAPGSLSKILRSFGCSSSVRCNHSAKVSGGKKRKNTGIKYNRLWCDLLANPSQWWDNRSGKPNVRFPDFKHKETGEGLWLIDGRNPPWVATEIPYLAQGASIFSRAQKLAGFNKTGQYRKTLENFEKMRQDGIAVDEYVYVHVLNACAALKALEEGRRIHSDILKTGCNLNLHLSSGLIDMYTKCWSINEAWKVFHEMPKRDAVAWTAMILGCVKCGENFKALELYEQMRLDGFEPDGFTFVGLLNACSSIPALEEGRRVHNQIFQAGLESDTYIRSGLVDMYAKCGSVDEAWNAFNEIQTNDVVVWNAMIRGFVKCGQELKAIQLFQQMQEKCIEPDIVTFLGLLNACAGTVSIEEGRRVHEHIILRGFQSDVQICSSLVDMYSKRGSIDEAWGVFEKMPAPNVVAWTTMILGFVKCGEGTKALELYHEMQEKGVEPDSRTFVAVLNACAAVAALEEGKRVHEQIRRSELKPDGHIGSSLVDMYSKCGSLVEASRVFNNIPIFARDVVAWTAMIMGYAMYGYAKEAIAIFEEMSRAGCKMNEVTFVCLLSACSHGGLVKEGMQYFESMSSIYGVSPLHEHYTCIVDLLGRAGRLDDAEAIVKSMKLEPCAATWMSLLSACRIHGNVEMGERASKRILELDVTKSAGYVLLSNLYAATGDFESKALVQAQRIRKGATKQRGRSWIEVNNNVHSFFVNDHQHPQILQIHAELAKLFTQLKDEGYIPDIRFALHDAEEETKVCHLGYHSEKLAIAFGLISTPAGVPLRIVKNLRVCGDCHTATKFISKVVSREIIVRDANRFHHFQDGMCSCGDYW